MKIEAYLVKDTGAALLLSTDYEPGGEGATQWIPRSVIPHLNKRPICLDEEYRQVRITIADWWLDRNPQQAAHIEEHFTVLER